jgi:hypothetical protein
MDLVPLQPPAAVQVVTLALDHVSVEEPPDATFTGEALMVTVGADVIVTIVD